MGELGDHGSELRVVVAVAGIGVTGEGDPPVGGDHQPEADQAQVPELGEFLS
jgi:hypothetical protein